MTRKELGDKVLYIEHRRKLSLAFFAAAVICGGAGAMVFDHRPFKDQDIAGQLLGVGAMLFVTSLALQHFSRTLVIDAASGKIVIEERRLLHFADRRELPLAGVEVRTRSTIVGFSRCYWIWLEYQNRLSTLFMGNIRDQRQLRQLVVRLREDLRCPGTMVLPPEE